MIFDSARRQELLTAALVAGVVTVFVALAAIGGATALAAAVAVVGAVVVVAYVAGVNRRITGRRR